MYKYTGLLEMIVTELTTRHANTLEIIMLMFVESQMVHIEHLQGM